MRPAFGETLGDRVARVRIRPGEAGRQVLDYLCTRFSYRNRRAWAAVLAQGDVQLNGRPASARQLLSAGDDLVCRAAAPPEPPVRLDPAVLYEDDDLLVVLTHPVSRRPMRFEAPLPDAFKDLLRPRTPSGTERPKGRG